MKDEYPVLLKYLQKEIFSVSDQATEIHLRYDVVVVYLLMEETNRAATAARGLLHYPQYPQLHALAAKVCELAYESDECFSDLKEISTTDKLLSSYLPFRPVDISGKNGKQRVFVKLSVPFPSFPKPSMRLTLSNSFLCEELRQQTNIEKKIDVPWIKKIKEGAIQFTEKIEESELDNSNIESKSSNDDECH